MGTKAQGDNIQVRQKPWGAMICVFVLGACVYCIGASRKILGLCPPGILSAWILSSMGFCPCGVLSPWAFVPLGFCLTWILSPLAFVPMGFCPPGFLSSWDFVRLDIVLWVFVQWDFVLEPDYVYITRKAYVRLSKLLYYTNIPNVIKCTIPYICREVIGCNLRTSCIEGYSHHLK